MALSRRTFLKGLTATGALVQVGLPPLMAMFDFNGTAYAADTAAAGLGTKAIDKRFLLWWNGNGIPERYWIPRETGADYELTPCLEPIANVRNYVHVLSGVDNVAARLDGQGNGHFSALCGSMTGTAYTGRGAAGPSIDQILAAKIGTKTRFRSLQAFPQEATDGLSDEQYVRNVVDVVFRPAIARGRKG